MKELMLIEVDIEEKKFKYTPNFTKLYALFAVFVAISAIVLNQNITDTFVLFCIAVVQVIIIVCMAVSLKRVLKTREEIQILFKEKRKIIKNLC